MDRMSAGEAPLTEVMDFRTYYQARTRVSASFLFGYLAFNFLLSPLYRLVTGLPPAPGQVLLLEWGLFVPGCLALAWLRWRGGRAVIIEAMTLLGTGFVGLALLAERSVWHTLGGPYFPGANALFFTVAMATLGVHYGRLFAVVVPVLVLEQVLGYVLDGVSAASHQNALFQGLAAVGVLVTGWQVHRAVWQTWDEGRYFQQLSERDALTGLLNLRAFEERARRVLARSALERRSVVLALVDFDNFERFNDQYGRLAGDRVLKNFARLVARFARQPLDLVARTGGEEFALLWYDVGEEWGCSRAGMLVRAACEMSLGAAVRSTSSLTASVGAVCTAGEATPDLAALLRDADANLREAKRRGGNGVVLTDLDKAFLPPDVPVTAAAGSPPRRLG